MHFDDSAESIAIAFTVLVVMMCMFAIRQMWKD